MVSFVSFSQKETKVDTNQICFPSNVGKQILLDLNELDRLKENKKLTDNEIGELEKKIVKQDSVISKLEQKDVNETETKTTYIQGGVEKTEITERSYYKGREIDISRYETYRTLMEILLTYNEESDDALGPEKALHSTPLPFKIAFNTLVKYGILKEL